MDDVNCDSICQCDPSAREAETHLALEEGDTLVDSLLDPTVGAHLARASVASDCHDVSESEVVAIDLDRLLRCEEFGGESDLLVRLEGVRGCSTLARLEREAGGLA